MVTEPLVNFGRVIRTVLVIIIITLIAWYAVEGRLWSYLPNVPEGDTLAKRLIDEKRSAKDCLKTYQIFPSSPPLSMARDACIETYAKIAKDPTVCEPLMQNEHRLTCLNTVGSLLFLGSHCTETYGRDELYCSQYSAGGELTITNPQIQNCNAYKRQDVQDWCYKKRTSRLNNIHECNKIINTIEYDSCENAYAFKKKDPSLCEEIQDEMRKKYCEIRINSWLKYPQLRESSYFGQQT